MLVQVTYSFSSQKFKIFNSWNQGRKSAWLLWQILKNVTLDYTAASCCGPITEVNV